MRIFADTPWALKRTFGFFGNGRQVVSLVGGGGKSTLMYFLAEKCAREGKKVLLSTTTHIYAPMAEHYADRKEAVNRLWPQGKFAVIGTPVPEKGKLKAPEESFLNEMMAMADVVFLESDGAKGYPCKVPKGHEPVLHPGSDLVIGVFGLSAIGRPLKEVCFRLEEAMELLGVEEDHILTAEDAAEMLSSPMGGRKAVGDREYCVILNQCDDGPRRRTGSEITARLAELGVPHVVMTSFDPEERAYYQKLAKNEE